MKDLNGQKIDELFRHQLEAPEIPFGEDDWLAMQRKLDKNNKRGYFYRGLALGGAAAALLIVCGWWLLRPAPLKDSVKMVNRVENNTSPAKKEATGNTDPTDNQPTTSRDETDRADRIAGLPPVSTSAGKSQSVRKNNPVTAFDNREDRNLNPGSLASTEPAPVTSPQELLALPLLSSIPVAFPTSSALAAAVDMQPYAVADTLIGRITDPVMPKFKPALILGLVAAPDFNAVNSFNEKKGGFSGGITATVTLSRSLSVTTGAIVAKKLYGTAFSNYKPGNGYQFPVSPDHVDADCRVLDIPLNINYQFYNKGKNALQLSAGASSYLMMKEEYYFNYTRPYPRYPKSYEVRNQNQHYLGVGNLALSYSRKLSPTASFAIQPYFKLPVTPIGYGNVKLLSSGVSFNLNVNVSEITKR